jgi:hypothetical protein
MGFQYPDVSAAEHVIRRLAGECASPYNDGWTSAGCKKDLYMLKCLIEDLYGSLPRFPEYERQWEQERIVHKLKSPQRSQS